jgi:hypothetical protein
MFMTDLLGICARRYDMKRWLARFDAACGWINPGLVVAAFVLAVLDVAAAGQRWAVAHPRAAVSAKAVTVAAKNDIKNDIKSEQCAPALPPELRDMIGRD